MTSKYQIAKQKAEYYAQLLHTGTLDELDNVIFNDFILSTMRSLPRAYQFNQKLKEVGIVTFQDLKRESELVDIKESTHSKSIRDLISSRYSYYMEKFILLSDRMHELEPKDQQDER